MKSDLLPIQQQLEQLQKAFQRKVLIKWFQPQYDLLLPISNSNHFLNYILYSPKNIDPAKANDYFKKYPPTNLGACSAAYRSGKVLRQFDWFYNESSEFMVKMNADKRRGVLHSSIGMAYAEPYMSRRRVLETIYNQAYNYYFDILPFTLVDGINEKGIYVQSNVVNSDNASNIDINPNAKIDCCLQLMLVRMLLDRVGDLSEIENVLDELHIYSTSKVEGYNIHIMVADKNRSKVIEFENDHYEVLDFPLMTNFRTNRGFEVIDKEHNDFSPKWNTIDQYGQGVERWELIAKFLRSTRKFEWLRSKLNFTNAYKNVDWQKEKPWLTEMCHHGGLDVTIANDFHTKHEDSQYYQICKSSLESERQKYLNRNRYTNADQRTWQTVHSCIYDTVNLSGQIQIQEGLEGIKEWKFKL